MRQTVGVEQQLLDMDDLKLIEEEKKYNDNEDFTIFLKTQAKRRKVVDMFQMARTEGLNSTV